MIRPGLDIEYFGVFHVLVIGIIYKTNFGFIGQEGTSDEVIICFQLRGSVEFYFMGSDFEGLDDLIEKVGEVVFFCQFFVEIIHNGI